MLPLHDISFGSLSSSGPYSLNPLFHYSFYPDLEIVYSYKKENLPNLHLYLCAKCQAASLNNRVFIFVNRFRLWHYKCFHCYSCAATGGAATTLIPPLPAFTASWNKGGAAAHLDLEHWPLPLLSAAWNEGGAVPLPDLEHWPLPRPPCSLEWGRCCSTPRLGALTSLSPSSLQPGMREVLLHSQTWSTDLSLVLQPGMKEVLLHF